MPGEIWSSNTNKAPKPSMRDCNATVEDFDIAVTTPDFSLASACRFRNLLCNLYQRACRLGNMPIASITSALRKLLDAMLVDTIAMAFASSRGLRDIFSLI